MNIKTMLKQSSYAAALTTLATLTLSSCQQQAQYHGMILGQQRIEDYFFEIVKMDREESATMRREIQRYKSQGHSLEITISAALSNVENTTTVIPCDAEVQALFDRWLEVEKWYYYRVRKDDYICIDPAYIYHFKVLDKDGKSIGVITSRSIYKIDSEERSLESDLRELSKAPLPQQRYVKLARQGDASSQLALGDDYLEDGGSVQKNISKALYWWKKAARQSEPRAFAQLGNYYKDKDIKLALSYYKKGAELNGSYAQLGLARCYRDGTGVPLNPQKAIHYYSEASKHGSVEAALELGILYRDGLADVQPDKTLAKQWLMKATTYGEPEAMKALNSLDK